MRVLIFYLFIVGLAFRLKMVYIIRREIIVAVLLNYQRIKRNVKDT